MILKDIWMDVKAVQERDPAARNALEVLLLYQGVHALIWHRVAHWFYEHHMFFIARLISQVARFFTLIEIHPGAQLGHGILIDHGCGVVIGAATCASSSPQPALCLFKRTSPLRAIYIKVVWPDRKSTRLNSSH